MSDQYTNYNKETIVHQLLKVQAQVTVTPTIKEGKPIIYCVKSDIKPGIDCDERKNAYYQKWKEPARVDNKCTFTLTQLLCVQIPISMDVGVDVDQGIVHCDTPQLGPCKFPHKEYDSADQEE